MQTVWKALITAAIALSVMATEARAEDYPEMKLRYANFAPEKSPHSKGIIFVADEL